MPESPLEWLESRVASSFRSLPTSKFQKAWNTEDNNRIINEWFSSEEKRTLVFTGSTNIVAMLEMPAQLMKGKTIRFLKLKPLTINDRIPQDDILVSEMTEEVSGLFYFPS